MNIILAAATEQPKISYTPIDSISTVFERVINEFNQVFFVVAPIALVVMLVWAGYRRLTAADNPQAVKEASGALFWAIAGFAILSGTFILINLIASIAGYNPSGSIFDIYIPSN